jgi:hypothetical protein
MTVIGQCAITCNDELQYLNTHPGKEATWAERVIRTGETKNACRKLVGKPVTRRELGRPRGRWMKQDQSRGDRFENRTWME